MIQKPEDLGFKNVSIKQPYLTDPAPFRRPQKKTTFIDDVLGIASEFAKYSGDAIGAGMDTAGKGIQAGMKVTKDYVIPGLEKTSEYLNTPEGLAALQVILPAITGGAVLGSDEAQAGFGKRIRELKAARAAKQAKEKEYDWKAGQSEKDRELKRDLQKNQLGLEEKKHEDLYGLKKDEMGQKETMQERQFSHEENMQRLKAQSNQELQKAIGEEKFSLLQEKYRLESEKPVEIKDVNGRITHLYSPGTGQIKNIAGQTLKGTNLPDKDRIKIEQQIRNEVENNLEEIKILDQFRSNIEDFSNPKKAEFVVRLKDGDSITGGAKVVRVQKNQKGYQNMRDIGLLYSVIKMLDPSSTVREGEIKLTDSGKAFFQSMGIQIGRTLEGTILDDQIRNAMLSLANDSFINAGSRLRNELSTVNSTIEEYGLNRNNIIGTGVMRILKDMQRLESAQDEDENMNPVDRVLDQ